MAINQETVLVVDDDPFLLEVMRSELSSLGVAEVDLAESAPMALSMIREGKRYTTLFSDISMPGMDGPQFLRQLAEIHSEIRIVLISGMSNDIMQSIGELGRSHGLRIVGFIHKPVSAGALQAMLEHDARSTQRPSGARAAQAELNLTRKSLLEALSKGEIRPWYQPKVDSTRLALEGVEALARWLPPGGRMISPGEFIPAIEQHGLALDLLLAILGHACADMKEWHAQGHDFKLAVNLSMDCAVDLELPEKLLAILSHYGIGPQQVVIEVTESRIMTDRKATIETLTRLSLAGFLLSSDDFGTGYSSLSQLADLPFRELKVDGSFVRRAGSDGKANAILNTTVTFGRSLAMDVVAEGVENFAQVDLLRRIGTPTLQGFLFAKPMAREDFDRWLAGWRPGTVHAPGCRRTRTLLVVDDSAVQRGVIQATLAELLRDWTIKTAADAIEAESVARECPIDAMTIDYHMPGINGIDLLRRMRDLCPASRFVILTSDLANEVAAEATTLGAMYCPKPLTTAQALRIATHFAID